MKITIFGMGYVGLPLAVEFSKHFETAGFDIDGNRIRELKKNIDRTNECSEFELNNATINNSIIKTVNFYIKKKYKPIIFTARGLGSFNSISKFLKKNSIVFFSPVLLLGNTKFKFYLLKILILLKKKIILIDDLSDLNFESLEFVTYNIKDFNICESKNFKYINPKSL